MATDGRYGNSLLAEALLPYRDRHGIPWFLIAPLPRIGAPQDGTCGASTQQGPSMDPAWTQAKNMESTTMPWPYGAWFNADNMIWIMMQSISLVLDGALNHPKPQIPAHLTLRQAARGIPEAMLPYGSIMFHPYEGDMFFCILNHLWPMNGPFSSHVWFFPEATSPYSLLPARPPSPCDPARDAEVSERGVTEVDRWRLRGLGGEITGFGGLLWWFNYFNVFLKGFVCMNFYDLLWVYLSM